MSEWISVEDRLPEPLQPVVFVVRCPGGYSDGRVLGGRYSTSGWFTTPTAGWEATYWMPIPDPPTDLRRK